MKEFGLLKRRNFTKGAPEPTSTEKKNAIMEQYEYQLLQTFCVKFVKKDTTSTNVRNKRKMGNFQGKKSRKKQVNW